MIHINRGHSEIISDSFAELLAELSVATKSVHKHLTENGMNNEEADYFVLKATSMTIVE